MKSSPLNKRTLLAEQKTRLQKFLYGFHGYKKYFSLVLMLLPIIVYFIIFKYVPMYGVTLAFKDYNIREGIIGSPWVGLKYFEKAFSSRLFLRSVRNTLIISLMQLVISFPAPIIMALMLNEVTHKRYKSVIQTITYLPHFISWVIMAGIFQQLLSPSNGAVNSILQTFFGLEKPIYFLGDNNYFRGTLVVTSVWKGVGWGSILYLATISNIDTSLYEAAECDGATRWQCMWYITLPSLLPTITVMLILNVGSFLDVGFDQVFNLYNAAVYETGDVIETYVYREGLVGMKYSFSTAVNLFKNVIGFILVTSTNFLSKKISGNGIW